MVCFVYSNWFDYNTLDATLREQKNKYVSSWILLMQHITVHTRLFEVVVSLSLTLIIIIAK